MARPSQSPLLAWILETGRPARHDDVEGARGPVITRVREFRHPFRGWSIDRRVRASQQDRLPSHTEERVSDFADVVAAAIANAANRAELLA